MVLSGRPIVSLFSHLLRRSKSPPELLYLAVVVVVEVLLYVHRNRRLIRDGSPGRPPRLSHGSSRALYIWHQSGVKQDLVDILGL